MTNTLTGAREQLATLLTAGGLKALDHLPNRFTPPVALVTAGSPWVSNGETFGTFELRYTVTLVAPPSVNDVTTDALDALVADALVALHEAPDWGVDRVDEPHMLVANGAEYLAASLSVVTTTAIETD